MRLKRFGLLTFLLVSVAVWAQQPGTSQQGTTPTPAPQDPEAVSVLTQALALAGGTAAIEAIADYTATGNITCDANPAAQGSVTVLALGVEQVRLDANLPRGVRSFSISAGQTTTKTEDGRLNRYPPPYALPSSEAQTYQPPMFPGGFVLPYAQLAIVLGHPRFNIAYKGVVQLDGKSVYDIQALRVMPGQTRPDSMTEYHVMDVFVDVATLQLVMSQDNVPNHIVHQIRYSDYRPVNGVLVPYSIDEQLGGQRTRDIQLIQVSLNTGLQNSAFAIQ
jgi:hypothetical protein